MRRRSFMVFIVLCVLGASSALASLYRWNETKRPPISLAEALERAEVLLGDEAASRYCVSVVIYGNERGDGTDGKWNLLYAAADGSKKHVHIDMRGEGGVNDWNGPMDVRKEPGLRDDLGDVRARIEKLFRSERIDADIDVADGTLTVRSRVRPYQVHRRGADGEYTDELETVEGPRTDGTWLRVRLVDRPDRQGYGYGDGVYWTWQRGTYYTREPGTFLSVDLRYGNRVKREIIAELSNIFGTRAP